MSDDRKDRTDEAAVDPARADSFAKLIDGMLEGQPIPPALDADDRAMLESATMIVASTQELRLSSEKSRSIVEEALEQAIAPGRRLSTVPESKDQSVPVKIERENTDVVRLSTRRADRVVRALPWVVAGVAAAAALLLFLSRPANKGTSEVASREVPAYQTSRPADTLIGRITADRAADASDRLDTIYADRMAGFRELKLAGSGAATKEKTR